LKGGWAQEITVVCSILLNWVSNFEIEERNLRGCDCDYLIFICFSTCANFIPTDNNLQHIAANKQKLWVPTPYLNHNIINAECCYFCTYLEIFTTVFMWQILYLFFFLNNKAEQLLSAAHLMFTSTWTLPDSPLMALNTKQAEKKYTLFTFKCLMMPHGSNTISKLTYCEFGPKMSVCVCVGVNVKDYLTSLQK